MSQLCNARPTRALVLAGALIALSPASPAQARLSAPIGTAAHHTSVSTGAIVIAALAALLTLGCLAWAIMRRRGFEPRWQLSLRHTIAEAGYRASATWAEFTDWVRLGH
jgi:hypothetical protein